MSESTINILETGRICERLFVVSAGLVCVILGWHLFKTGVLTQQTASGEYKGLKIIFSKVGPGAFFAAFGCLVLAVSLFQPLKITVNDIPNTPHVNVEYINEAGVSDDDLIRAVNAVASASRTSDDQRLLKAHSALDTIKARLALKYFSSGEIEIYNKNKDLYRSQPAALTPQERETVKRVMERMEAEFDEKG